jgi:hypothetical protein
MTQGRTIGWLEGLTANVKGERIELKGASFLIGRGTTANVQLNDPQVSREHARISYADKQLKLDDLDSRHGTYLNGDPVTSASLKNGDRIRFGGSLFHLHVAKSVTEEMKLGQDDLATVLDDQDAIATELASPDDIATYLSDEPVQAAAPVLDVVCAQCGAKMSAQEKFCGECGQLLSFGEPAANVRAEQVQDQTVLSQPQVKAPVVAPPAGPRVVRTPPRKRLPTWALAAVGGVVVLVLIGAGLLFTFKLLGGESTEDMILAEEISTVEEAPAEIAASDQAEEPTVEQAVISTEEPISTMTLEPAVLEEATSAPPTPAPTDAPPMAGLIGGASGIAFASDRTGYPQIYYMDLSSRALTQLTDQPTGACQPAWSPDGTRLAFTSPCGSNREAYKGSTIFLMEVDQAGKSISVQPLVVSVGGGDYDPDWAPDGSRLAFTSQRTGRPQVFTIGIDGQNPFNVNDDLAHNWGPSWSGDGSQIAFLTGRGGAEEIWLVPATGGDEQRFSRSDGKAVARPDWSPDGATIVFEKVVGSIPRIVAAPVVDRGVRVIQICQEGQLSLQPMGEPALSPDGMWVAFETWPGGGDHKIAMMQVSCTGYEELTLDPALDFDVAWRPSQ